MSKNFTSTGDYIVDEELARIVEAAVALERPLLIKGEPGTGKTRLAHAVAAWLGKPLLTWNVKSTTRAQEGLYTYDTVARLNDARFGDHDISDIGQYIKLGKLGQAFASKEQCVLLIDEIDKAELEFPNDLLAELDEMRFHIPETDETIAARQRPIVIITSNAEKELPDAFLRRCVFHYIAFPDEELMKQIIRVHYPDLEEKLADAAIGKFYEIRAMPEIRKAPSTSELLDWIRTLVASGVDEQQIAQAVPLLGVLLKKPQDVQIAERKMRWIS